MEAAAKAGPLCTDAGPICQIVEDIRAQVFHDNAEESADFVQFVGEAGVGQAEAGSLTKGDLDWARNFIRFRRRKTQVVFQVPIYNHLKPLLKKLEGKLGTDAVCQTRLFNIKEARKALAGACRRLNFC